MTGIKVQIKMMMNLSLLSLDYATGPLHSVLAAIYRDNNIDYVPAEYSNLVD
jgi:hypothetical protein